jgi:hypothetical protein
VSPTPHSKETPTPSATPRSSAPPQFLFTLLEIAWELSLTVYLIARGFKPTPITAEGNLTVG